jgi:hypothetical protein
MAFIAARRDTSDRLFWAPTVSRRVTLIVPATAPAGGERDVGRPTAGHAHDVSDASVSFWLRAELVGGVSQVVAWVVGLTKSLA